jgi:hypothetical protein
MSDDVLDQLGAYGRFHRLHQNPVTLAEVAEYGTVRPAVAEPLPPRRPRRWLIAAAAVGVAVLLVASALLLQQTEDGHIQTKPAGPAVSTFGTPPTTAVTQPPNTPGDSSAEVPLLPEGVPSNPDTSELAASVQTSNGDSPYFYYLYADGRLVWFSRQVGERGGYIEQRLTPEGVERVRSRFLSSGLFDPAQPQSGCKEPALCVRADDGRLLSTLRWQSAEGYQLLAYIKTLDSSLPEAEWADKEIKPHIPPAVAVCVDIVGYDAVHGAVEAPADLAVLLPLFPARAAELLGGREPVGPIPTIPARARCYEMTLEEARALAAAFLDPAVGGKHQDRGIVITFNSQFTATQPGGTGSAAYVSFYSLPPDAGG